MTSRAKRNAPTKETLVKLEDESKTALLSEASKIGDLTGLSEDNLRQICRDLKQLVSQYESASRALSTWYTDHAHVADAIEVGNARFKIIHQDCRELIRNLNSAITEMGGDKESSIGDASAMVSRRTSKSLPSLRGPSNPVPFNDPVNTVNEDEENLETDDDFEDASVGSLRQRVTAMSLEPKYQRNNSAFDGPNRLSLEDPQDVEPLDPISRRQLRQELLKGLGEPFSGEPHKFWCWQQQISRRLLEAEAGALDSLHILQANCTGRAKSIVSTHINAGAANPKYALDKTWKDLKKRFGSNALVSNSLLGQLESVQNIKSPSQVTDIEDLRNLCTVIYANMDHCPGLRYLDMEQGMCTVWEKLPMPFQGRWQKRWHIYERKTGMSPCFSDFVEFLNNYIDEISIPAFRNRQFSSNRPSSSNNTNKRPSKALKTESNSKSFCSYHNDAGHSLSDCSPFKKLTFSERKKFASDNKLCFNCLGAHRRTNCKLKSSCAKCGSKHLSVMHPDRPFRRQEENAVSSETPSTSETTSSSPSTSSAEASANCSRCEGRPKPKVCSKTLVVQVKAPGSKVINCLCILDEQSDNSFCDPKLLELLGVTGTPGVFSLRTMHGLRTNISAMSVEGIQVKGLLEKKWISLPPLTTHSGIPSSHEEVATPEIVSSFRHLKPYVKHFPNPSPDYDVLLLVGADSGEAMKTTTYGSTYPWVHKTALGYALVGPVCNDLRPNRLVKSLRTQVESPHEHLSAIPIFDKSHNVSPLTSNVFTESIDDDLPGLSQDDKKFVDLMSSSITVNEKGMLEMPLPLREDSLLPKNKDAVFIRTRNTLARLRKNQATCQEAVDIMGKYLLNQHVEEVPAAEWKHVKSTYYIPIFPVKQESKSKLRLVFDSSASFGGSSLNDHLLQGPDENNRLTGVLTRFRHGSVGFAADIQCMFHCFFVSKEHRDSLRFFWFANNNPENDIVPYRANVHIFGNKSSPAVANFGLRYAANSNSDPDLQASRDFINKNVYVDDTLGSSDNPEQAISILQGARQILERYKIRLHKIVSNSQEVLDSFPESERQDTVGSVDFSPDAVHKTLGLTWKISDDKFVIKCSFVQKKFNRRGVLSTINALFDPLGMVAPIILQGRLLQRQFIPGKDHSTKQPTSIDWDEPLPEEYLPAWESWISSMSPTCQIEMPRSFTPSSFGMIVRREFHVFSDASEDAIGYVIYLRSVDEHNNICVSFVSGCSKVSPRAATSIPRLELCAAVEATYGAVVALREIDRNIDSISFYTDSRVILGYINNEERRFSRYVTTRVNQILKRSTSSQWQYVSTSENTADIASRPQTPSTLLSSRWFVGPEFLQFLRLDHHHESDQSDVDLPEVVSSVKALTTKTNVSESLISAICLRKSSWPKAVNIVSAVLNFCNKRCKKIIFNPETSATILIREVQKVAFCDTYNRLQNGHSLPSEDSLASLSPYLDESSVMRVGGRLKLSNLLFEFKHPIVLPPDHNVTIIILRHFHEKVKHQGRHITLGALREAGYHIHKGTPVVKRFLSNCVQCRKLRTKPQQQKMSDLPSDRIEEAPPFSSVGIDCFGPYLTHDGRDSRRIKATKKIWVVLFTCLSSRAIHLEPICSLNITSFRLALQRFTSLRGQCKLIRSDNGTNLVGTKNQLDSTITVEELQGTSEGLGCKWEFIPPGASHMGGAWERKIGSVKKVLNASIKLLQNRSISREEFHTLLQEAASIVNSTPLYEISADPNDPFPVSPSMLLTLKDHPHPSPPESFSQSDLLAYGKKRWRRVSYLSDQFWKRWRQNYVCTLQERRKWIRPEKNLQVNDIVMLRTPSPRNHWPVGSVESAELATDGLVRAVNVFFPSTKRTLRRCVHDLVLLVPANGSDR